MPDVDLDTNGSLSTDLNCVGCSYNLRGLEAEAACPECGVAVGRSLSGDLLQYANPEWVDVIARALSMAGIALVVGFVMFVPFAVFWHDLYTAGWGGWLVAAAVVGIPAFIGLLACWMFSMKETNGVSVEPSPNWRLIARWSAVGLVLLLLIEGPLELNGVSFWRGAIAVGIAVATIGVYAAGRLAVNLANRVPDQRLARDTRITAIGCTFVGASATFGMTLLAINPTLALFSWTNVSPVGYVVTTVVALGLVFTVVAFLIFGIATVALMFRFDKALRTAAQRARQTWAKEK